jgi:hypothetical protein
VLFGFLFTILESDLWDSTILNFRLHEASVFSFGIRSVGNVVFGVFLLSFGSVMNPGVGPGVSGNSPGAIRFNSNVVNSSDDSDESIFTKMRAPWVSDNPVLGAVFYAKSDNWDIVNNVLITGSILEDTAGIVFKGGRDSNTASNGSSLVDFLHHSFFSWDSSVLIDVVNVVLVRYEAGFVRVTVPADGDVAALNTVVVTSGVIDWTGLIGDVGLMHELESTNGFTTMATIIIHGAWNDDLRGDVDIGPGSFSGDLDSVWESWSSSMSPAWSTILRDVLVPNVG